MDIFSPSCQKELKDVKTFGWATTSEILLELGRLLNEPALAALASEMSTIPGVDSGRGADPLRLTAKETAMVRRLGADPRLVSRANDIDSPAAFKRIQQEIGATETL